MGQAASSPGMGGGLGHSGGDIIRRCNCYSVNNMSLDRKCYRHSLTFNTDGDKTSINPKQKKKRNLGFATFKKKLIGKRRHCKGSDHGRYFREHFVECPPDVLRSLMAQYEALTLLKDLSVQADLARPPAMTLSQSLTDLHESEDCCDLILCYQGHRIPVHRAILMARCPYFSRHLTFSKGAELNLRTPNYTVSLVTLKRALKYLYSGSAEVWAPSTTTTSDDPNESGEFSSIALLQDEFGTPNSLESDIAYLWETSTLADCRLTFNYSSHPDKVLPELLCHRTILAARSGFFRRLIERRVKADPSLSNSVLDICLDGSVVPAKYGRLLIHVMYHDTLDLRLIDNDFSSFNFAHSGVSVAGASCQIGDNIEDQDDQAMNLYEIGRFLEFNFLSLSCEDLLLQHLGASNVIKILEWSLKPHGSAWISRQAFLYLEEEFYLVANSDVLSSLDQETLAKILQSDFIQASEAEILQALIRWGEFQLNSRNSNTKDPAMGNTVSTLTRRREPKRREVCESQLKELLAPLFPLVRFPHILPRDKSSEVLDMVRSRNLYPVLPNFTSQISCYTKYSPWDPRAYGWFVRPRLFIPYFEECKNLIQDRCAPDPELISSSSPCIGDVRPSLRLHARKKASHDEVDEDEEDHHLESLSTKPPDKEMITKMLERRKKLLSSYSVKRSLAVNFLFIDQKEIIHLVELRVVREFNLPDNYVNILRKMRTRNHLVKRELMCASSFYAAFDQFYQSSRLEMDPQQCGPDVTLASNAMSALSLSHHHHPTEPDSPDLVSVEGSNVSFTGGGNRYLKNPRQKRQSIIDQVFHHGSSELTNDQVLMSRSFNCPQSSPRDGSLNFSSSTSKMYL